MSLLKYVQGDNKNLSYSRAEADGMPWRGPRLALKEEEYEALTEVVNDGHVGVFDLSKPDELAKINEIVDKVSNGWWKLSSMKEQFIVNPDGSYKVVVYCVWVEPHRQLATHKLPAALQASLQTGSKS